MVFRPSLQRLSAVLFLGLGGCATAHGITQDESCRYVRRVGSHIPRLECDGQPVAQSMYGEINRAQLQNTLAGVVSQGRAQ